MVTANDGVQAPHFQAHLPTASRWKSLLKLGLMIVLAQALFWGLFYVPWGNGPPMRSIKDVDFTSVTLAELDAPTPAAADAGTYNKVNLPYTDCCDAAYLALRLTFDLQDIPDSGLGMIATQQVDNFIYTVNGSVIHQKGRMEFGNQTFHGQQPYLLHMPKGLLKPGENQVTIITVRDGFPYTDLYPPKIAEYQLLREVTAMRFWQTIDYRILGGALTFVLGLLALVMVFRAQEKIFAAWLMVLCWTWSAYAAYGLWFDLPFGGIGRMVAFFVISSLITISLIGFIDSWTRRPLYKAQIGLIVVWIGYCAFSIYALNRVPMPQGYDLMDVASQWYALFGGALVLLRLLWHFGTVEEDRTLEAALLSICAVCLALDGIGAKFGMNPGGYLIESAAILMLAFVFAFLQRNFHLFQSAMTLNTLLETNLRKREAELAKATAQQARNEERRRLMRDMHDGVGGQLVGLLLEVRRGAIDHNRMAEGLQVAMDEIRLMIDSVDSTTTSFQTMLNVFESRVRPRVQGAGIDFDFVTELNGEIDLDPPQILQIFRIMQEAVTNALKHAGADTLSVEVRHDAQVLKVTISDNGRGLATPSEASSGSRGHGLDNMRNRALTMGGDVTWQDAQPGTRVCLSVNLTPSLAQTA